VLGSPPHRELLFTRHTEQWVELYGAVSVDECLKAIQDDPWFQP
jgi:hypothetical protein